MHALLGITRLLERFKRNPESSGINCQVAFLHEHGSDTNNALDEETFEKEASETRPKKKRRVENRSGRMHFKHATASLFKMIESFIVFQSFE